MASYHRRSDHLQRLHTHGINYQYQDGPFPAEGSIGYIANGTGNVDWSAASVDAVGNMIVPGTLDASEGIFNSVTIHGSTTDGVITFNNERLLLNGAPISLPIYSSVSNKQGEGGDSVYTFYNSPKYIVNGLSTITGYVEYSTDISENPYTLLKIYQGADPNPIWYVSATTVETGYLNFSVILEAGSYSFSIINSKSVVFDGTPRLYLRAIRHI